MHKCLKKPFENHTQKPRDAVILGSSKTQNKHVTQNTLLPSGAATHEEGGGQAHVQVLVLQSAELPRSIFPNRSVQLVNSVQGFPVDLARGS